LVYFEDRNDLDGRRWIEKIEREVERRAVGKEYNAFAIGKADLSVSRWFKDYREHEQAWYAQPW
jgi:hypothetical protein